MKRYLPLAAAFPRRVLRLRDGLPPDRSFRTIPANACPIRPRETILRKLLMALLRSLGAFSV